MSKYIDKSAVIAKIDEFVKQNAAYGFSVDVFDIEMMKKMIEKLPAADVAPVVHAYWIYQKPYDEYTWRPYICSSCKTHGGKHRTNYCQSCGAKMDLCPHKREKNGGDTDV